MKRSKRLVSFLLAVLTVLTCVTVGVVPGAVKAQAAGWNGYTYGGGSLYGYQTFLEAFGIDYNVYMKWMDDHDADSDDPHYYLGTPYEHGDHRNPLGDCDGARGDLDTPGVAALNCTGFVWHVLYKSAVYSGATSEQISRLQVMYKVPISWEQYGVYRIYFDSLEDAYDSGVLEKGDLFWIYGTKDNHNAIFYGENPHHFIYWDSAGVNRQARVAAAGECRGLWVAKVTQPNQIELHIDSESGGTGTKFGTKYAIFDSKAKAQAAVDRPSDSAVWDKREGTIVLDQKGHGHFRVQGAPAAKDLWAGNTPVTGHSYFRSATRRVNSKNTYYAVQFSRSPGIAEDKTVREFRDSGERTAAGWRIFRCSAPINVATPHFTSVKSVKSGIELKWKPVKDAYQYFIYYKNRKGSWTKLVQTTKKSYVDKAVKTGVKYTYAIRCADKAGNFISDYDRGGRSLTYNYLAKPRITKLQSTPEGVKIKWSAVKGKNFVYRLYYKNRSGWHKLTDTTATTFTDKRVTKGKNCAYTVRCISKDGESFSQYNKAGWRCTYKGVTAPRFTSAESTPNGIRLKWNKIAGVSKYRIYIKNAAGKWKTLADTKGGEYLHKQVAKGKTYTYAIRCMNSKGYLTSKAVVSGRRVTYRGVATPRLSKITDTPQGVSLTWNAVKGAAKYRVYKNVGGKWTKLTDTTGVTFTDSYISAGKTGGYTIRCLNSAGLPASDFVLKGWKHTYAGVTPAFTAAVSKPDGIRLKWEKIPGVSKYRLYRRDLYGNWRQMTETKGGGYFDNSVTAGSTYVYAIRTLNSKGRFTDSADRKNVKVVYTGVGAPQITALTGTAKGVLISWDPVENASLYRVFVKDSSGSWISIAETDGTSYTDTNVSAGNTYTYTVRCFNSGGKPAGTYHKGKSITYTGAEG